MSKLKWGSRIRLAVNLFLLYTLLAAAAGVFLFLVAGLGQETMTSIEKGPNGAVVKTSTETKESTAVIVVLPHWRLAANPFKVRVGSVGKRVRCRAAGVS
jgi:hypothetical protein